MDEFCGSEFWNLNVTWNTDDPNFTPCFQQTVLIWIPCVVLWALTPLELYYVKISKYSNIPWGFVNISQLLVTVLLIGLTISDLVVGITLQGTDGVNDVHSISPLVKLVTFTIVVVLRLFQRKFGIMSSGSQFLFWLILMVAAIPMYRTEIEEVEKWTDNEFETIWPTYKFVSCMIYFPLLVIQVLLHCFADQMPRDSTFRPESTTGTKPNPQTVSGFLRRISFIWFEPMVWKGYRNPLTTDDVYDLSPEDTTHELVPYFDRYWHTTVENGKKKMAQNAEKRKKKGEKVETNTRRTNGSIMPAMFYAFGAPFWCAGFLKLIIDLLSFAQPFLLGFLIDFTVDHTAPLWQGIFYMILLIGVSLLTAFLNGQYLYRSFLVGFRIKTSLISLIYRKALTISPNARKDTTVGEIVNLMAVDAQRFFETVQYLHLIWAGPLVIILAIYFLWQILGVAVVSGLVVMILMIPLNAWVAAQMRRLQVKQMKQKDERVKLMNEILNGMKVLKLYAWELSFEKYIHQVRGNELNTIKLTALWNAVTFVLWTLSPFLVTLLSFATYVLMDENNVIDARTAFVSLTLFNLIRMPLIIFPMALSQALQCWVAISRINKYLNSEDLAEGDITHYEDKDAVKIENGTFSWGGGDLSLKNIHLSVEKESLVAVVGTVGSGKSTLISAMLGEIEKMEGKVNTCGTIAYVPQQAWMQNATLKDNITFGKPFDQEFYDKVVEACALIPDLKMLPGGDQTEIGEKGINLSGGQKQRISLARAVYNQADLYLMDDPLSAVDSHVGKHIFEKVIGPKGILAGKTRILVTHGITYLPQVDTIHVMKSGEITESGTYKQLLGEKGAFASFIEEHLQESVDEEELKEIQEILEDNQVGAKIFNRAISTRSSISAKRRASKTPEKKLSIHEIEEEKIEGNDNKKLIVKEESQTGAVDIGVYITYFKSVGWMFMTMTLISSIAYQISSVYSSTWLSEWSEDADSIIPHVRDMYLGVYGGLGLLQTIFVFGMGIGMAIGCVLAARDLHNNLLKQTMRLPMSFFDTTPIGRIVNRFSKDVDTVDNIIPLILRFFLLMGFSVVSVFVIISIQTPMFLVVVLPIGIVYYFIQAFYIRTSRQLKRIESVTRSPIYSHFGETLTGQSTIRAYGVQTQFIDDIHQKVNLNQMCAYPSLVIANRWLAIRLEIIGTFILLFAVLFAILNRTSGGSVGLSISYAMQVTQLLNFLVRMTAEIETNIVANERMEEYNDLPKEAEWIGKEAKDPKWPAEGRVIFKDFKLRYRENLDLVLKGINLSVKGGEKVGIVGRTGAGKSSLTLGLFRIVEAAGGSIIIDDEDISELGLHSLRSRLTIIPQDPVLFSGTLRMNIDPVKLYTDEQIWSALEHSHLKSYVKSTPNGLDNQVTEGGENMSVGQRQLLCLARALLRKTKVLILDEATAAVDLETDDLIQRTIRTQFKECTILTIAHRLNTILDSDKVLVLDQGCVAEFDTPKNLLDNKQSIFYSMAKDAGLVGNYGNNGGNAT